MHFLNYFLLFIFVFHPSTAQTSKPLSFVVIVVGKQNNLNITKNAIKWIHNNLCEASSIILKDFIWDPTILKSHDTTIFLR